MSLPKFNESGDLPVGVYKASLKEVSHRFGSRTLKRQQLAHRLEYIHKIASGTGKIAHFVLFGSFVTKKSDPNDLDIFLIMEDDFEVSSLTGDGRILFNHLQCQGYFGASIFWVRRMAALGGEQAAIEDWQIKRDGNSVELWRLYNDTK